MKELYWPERLPLLDPELETHTKYAQRRHSIHA